MGAMLRAPPRRSEPRHAVSGRSERPRPGERYVSRRVRGPILLAAILVLALLAIGAASFGPLVRAKIAREAARHNLEIEVATVRPLAFGIALHDVRVRPRGLRGLEARIERVRIDLGLALSVHEVTASGGGLFIEGELDEVTERLRSLRPPSGSSTLDGGLRASGTPPPMTARDLSISWKLGAAGELTGSGLSVARDGSGTRIGCAKCIANRRGPGRGGQVSIEATEASAELDRDGVLRRVSSEALSLGLVPSNQERQKLLVAPPAMGIGISEPSPPPLPAVGRRGAKPALPAPRSPATPATDRALPLPDLHALRARLRAAAALMVSRLPDGASVDIGGLSIRLDLGGEPVAFGPGAFMLTRRADRVHLEFASMPDGGTTGTGTPLSIDADLPIGAGEITARLAGGPVSLAALGIKEGTKGLSDVSSGRISGKGLLVLSSDADALSFDGEVTLRSISLMDPRIASDPLRGIDFSVAARGVLAEAGRLRVDEAQLHMGALHLRTHGILEETSEHFSVSLAVDVAPASCQALLDSSPQGLTPMVRAARMAGTFSATVSLAFDTRAIDKLLLDYNVDDQCRMLEVPPALARDRFSSAFTYRTYRPDGTIGETTTGPGTPNWTDLDDISPFMVAAVLTTEDGAFYKHHGFNHPAIRSSALANLKARRFVRGASTITMQLAKNLFLARDKALSRKLEEVVLADYLEQIFRKDDMMELYLNVVEFGPDVYGIAHAAEHYFGRKPEELNLAECFFLASLLPAPLRYGKLRDKGEVSETWMRHLRALMMIAARSGKISRVELEEGLKESVVFVRPGDPRPTPRKPVTSHHRDADDDDAAWRPLD